MEFQEAKRLKWEPHTLQGSHYWKASGASTNGAIATTSDMETTTTNDSTTTKATTNNATTSNATTNETAKASEENFQCHALQLPVKHIVTQIGAGQKAAEQGASAEAAADNVQQSGAVEHGVQQAAGGEAAPDEGDESETDSTTSSTSSTAVYSSSESVVAPAVVVGMRTISQVRKKLKYDKWKFKARNPMGNRRWRYVNHQSKVACRLRHAAGTSWSKKQKVESMVQWRHEFNAMTAEEVERWATLHCAPPPRKDLPQAAPAVGLRRPDMLMQLAGGGGGDGVDDGPRSRRLPLLELGGKVWPVALQKFEDHVRKEATSLGQHSDGVTRVWTP